MRVPAEPLRTALTLLAPLGESVRLSGTGGVLVFRSGDPARRWITGVILPGRSSREAFPWHDLTPDHASRLHASLESSSPVHISIVEGGLELRTGRSRYLLPPVAEISFDAAQDPDAEAHLSPEACRAFHQLFVERTGDTERRVRISLTPGMGTWSLLQGGVAVTSRTFGPGADLPAKLHVEKTREVTVDPEGMEPFLKVLGEDLGLGISGDGLILGGTAGALAAVAYWPRTPVAPPASVLEGSPGVVSAVRPSLDAPAKARLEDADPLAALISPWEKTGWKMGSSTEGREKAARHWEGIWRRLRELWPEAGELPWKEGTLPSASALAGMIVNPRAVLVEYLDIARRSPQEALELDPLLSHPIPPPGFTIRLPAHEDPAPVPSQLEKAGIGWPEKGEETRSSYYTQRPTRRHVIPAEFLRALHAATREEAPLRWATRRTAPTGRSFVHFPSGPHLPLALFLSLLERREVRVTKGGYSLYQASRLRLQQRLGLPSLADSDALLLMARQQGLLSMDYGTVEIAPDAGTLFALSPAELRARCAGALCRGEGPRPLEAKALLEVLATEGAGHWLDTGGLSILARRRVAKGVGYGWTHRPDREEHGVWQALRILSLAGIVETAFDGEIPVEARLTPDGALTLGSPPVSPALPDHGGPPPRVHVLPDYEVSVPSEVLTPEIAWPLSRMADMVSADRVVRFKLTRASVTGAALRGVDVVSAVRLLRKASDRALPPNVSGALEEWGRVPPRAELVLEATVRGPGEILTRLSGDGKEADVRPGGGMALTNPDVTMRLLGESLRKRDLARSRMVRVGREGRSWGLLLLSPEELASVRSALVMARERYGHQSSSDLLSILDGSHQGALPGAAVPPGHGGEPRLTFPVASPLVARPPLPALLTSRELTPVRALLNSLEQQLFDAIQSRVAVTVFRDGSRGIPEGIVVSPYYLLRGENGSTYVSVFAHDSWRQVMLSTGKLRRVESSATRYHEPYPGEAEAFVEDWGQTRLRILGGRDPLLLHAQLAERPGQTRLMDEW